ASNFQLRDLTMGDDEFVISGFYADNVATAFGAVSLPANGRVDQAFLLRMDTTGVEQAAYRVDTDRIADGATVAIRQSGGLCLGGRFAGNADFDGDGTTDATFKGGYGDAFVVALRADGSTQWFRAFGTAGDDQPNDLVAVGDDCVAVGHLGGAVTLPSGQTLGGAGGLDGFAMRLAAADGATLWARAIGSAGSDQAMAAAVDALGQTLVGGHFVGQTALGSPHDTQQFDTAGAAEFDTAGAADAFILTLSDAGEVVSFVTLGGEGTEVIRRLAVDANDGALVVGGLYDTAFTVDDVSFPAPAGDQDVWLLRLPSP
ncbi:MAG: hypothetical protein JRH20_32950, partial [Deltaproteobacteria bacterium]|nr:hypothetical protein [Deltaproteobacteria bacterium]